MFKTKLALISLLALTGCGSGEDETTTTTSQTTTSTTTSSTTTATTTTSQTTTTTTTASLTGFMYFQGIGITDAEGIHTPETKEFELTNLTTYDGSESRVYEAEDESVLCEISYDVTLIQTLDDCDHCWWALELERSNATIVSESGVGCLAVSGTDSDTVAELDGTSYYLGYNGDYYGHATVLFIKDKDEWNAVAFANFDDKTGTFDYRRDYGTFDY